MSTPEWIAALGLLLTHPALLIATAIGICAAFCFAWWLRGFIVRAHIDASESRVDGVAFEELKRKVEALERENAAFRAHNRQAKEAVLRDDTKRVLVHMFNATRGEEVGAMATALGMEIDLLQHHLERLLQSGLAHMINYQEGKKYWVLTQDGRRRVVENKLRGSGVRD